jgi:cytochrome b subunit of formate dehydrogenase
LSLFLSILKICDIIYLRLLKTLKCNKQVSMLKQIIKHIVIALSLIFLALGLISTPTSAQIFNPNDLPKSEEICGTGNVRGRLINCNQSNLAQLTGSIAGVLTFIIVSIAIIFIVYGAFVWMTDIEKGPEKGRKIITQAVIALVISVIAYGVVASLINFLNSARL